MRQIKDALQLTSLIELNKEIKIRKELLNQMVGQLYPPVIRGELIDLNERYLEIYHLVKENVDYLINDKN